MNYKIVADSSANLTALEGIPFESVPLKIIAGDKYYTDNAALDVRDMAEYMKSYSGRSSTSCPNVAEWMDAYGDADVVFAIAITSNLSGSYAAALQAKKDYEEANPGKRVVLCDSLSTGPEMKVIIEYVISLMKDGADADTIEAKVKEYTKHTHLLFSLESLRNLANNGRVSPAVAKIAGILGIRVVGRASSEGTLEQLHKCPGERKAINAIYSEMKKEGYEGGKVRIDHCFNEDIANAMQDIIKADFPDADIIIGENRGLCCFYAEMGGMLVGYEDNR